MQVSIVYKSELEQIKFRIDAEYYKPAYLALNRLIRKIGSNSLRALGGVLDCSAFYPSITSYYNFETKGIPFLRVNEIQDGFVTITENTAFLPRTVLDENKNTICMVQPEDLIIAKGGNSLAKVGIVPNLFSQYATCRDLIVLRTGKLYAINKFYVWMFLCSKFGQELLLKTASQTGQPHLTLESVYELQIPILKDFPLYFYERIYAELLSLNEKAKKLYHQAEQRLLSELGLVDWQPMHQTTFVRNFSDFLQADRLDAEYFQPKYFQLKKQLSQTIKDKGWEVRELGILSGKLKYGTSTKLTYLDSGIPFLRITDLSQYRFIPENLTYIAPHDAQTEPKVKTNDVLISRSGTLGLAVAIPKNLDDSVFGSYFIRIRPNTTRINPVYLALYLNSLIGRSQVEQSNTGAIQTNLTIPVIESILIALLPMKIQKEIAQNVLQSYDTQDQSKRLLEIAKRGVEIAIEQDEKTAEAWIQEQVEQPAARL